MLSNIRVLSLFKGDTLKLISAKDQKNRKIEGLNLVGYRSRKQKNRHKVSDIGDFIDTTKGFNRGWSKDKKGLVYAITVFTGNKIHGWVNIRLEEVRLDYADILINGKNKVMKAGVPLFLNLPIDLKLRKWSQIYQVLMTLNTK